jgi:hypothetical protein
MSNYSKFMPFNDLNISILIKTIRNDIKLSLNSKKKKKTMNTHYQTDRNLLYMLKGH